MRGRPQRVRRRGGVLNENKKKVSNGASDGDARYTLNTFVFLTITRVKPIIAVCTVGAHRIAIQYPQ